MKRILAIWAMLLLAMAWITLAWAADYRNAKPIVCISPNGADSNAVVNFNGAGDFSTKSVDVYVSGVSVYSASAFRMCRYWAGGVDDGFFLEVPAGYTFTSPGSYDSIQFSGHSDTIWVFSWVR